MVQKNRIPLFSKRIKLFSQNKKRISLFSNPEEETVTLKKVKCSDCGFEMETASNVAQILCPKCGGKRFNIVLPDKKSPIGTVEPIEDTETESKLKLYSGQTIGKEQFQKEFSNSEDLIEKGFAIPDGDNVTISESAYQIQKLFSKLTITVTKELDLDPDIMSGLRDKEDVIEDLENHNDLPEKGIVIIKKAHGLMPPFESNFSETDGEAWLSDSSIIPDLKVEYENQSFGIKQFMDILRDRYSDAPENIIDLLVSHGAIRIDGNQITINK